MISTSKISALETSIISLYDFATFVHKDYLRRLKISIKWHYPNKKYFVEKHSPNYAN